MWKRAEAKSSFGSGLVPYPFRCRVGRRNGASAVSNLRAMPTFGLADIVRAAKLTLLQKKKEMLEEEGSVRRHSVRSEEKNMKKGRKTA